MVTLMLCALYLNTTLEEKLKRLKKEKHSTERLPVSSTSAPTTEQLTVVSAELCALKNLPLHDRQ